MTDQVSTRSFTIEEVLLPSPSRGFNPAERQIEPSQAEPSIPLAEPSANELFDVYEKLLQTQPGTADAEIFEKIREWTFSDFSRPAHEFAGVTKAQLDAWQKRHRINLSAGHIRPESIDLQRGYAWGQIRIAAAANRLHGTMGPPSVDEVKRSWATVHVH